MKLILASSSSYRKELLERLRIPFSQIAPEIDESQAKQEAIADYVCRLSREKSRVIASQHPDACIIASDQAAAAGNIILGKPGTRDKAIEQLSMLSGRLITFYTGLCILYQDKFHVAIDTTEVHFRHLNESEIVRYIDLESPLNCAGSFKAEGLGITLFENIRSEDPTALIGLPMIKTAGILRSIGVNPLENSEKN